MSLTTAQKEKIVKLVIKDKISVSKLAGENDIARKTIYSWVKLYRNAASRNKKKALVTKYVSGKKHPKHKEVLLLEDKIIRIVKKNPQLSISGISKTLKAGHHAVYNALKALELTTEDSRLAFSNLYKFPGVLDPSIKISVVNSVLSNKKSITTLAKENHVARKTIYEWIKEFKAEGNVEEDYVSGFEHPRAYSETKVEAILSGVVNNPAFSIHKLAASLGLSSHGVYNVLFRYGLTHSGARFAYAQNIPSAEEKPSFNFFTRVIKSLTSFMSPNMLPAPPPGRSVVSSSTLLRDIFLVFLGTATATLLVTYFSFATFSGITNLGQIVGLIFAETALAFGSFFFLYSLKYYLSLAIVLSYSQKETSGIMEGKKGKGILSSILGEAKSSVLYSRDSKATGLIANLDNIHIKRHPFVSVHIPFYNEKNVVRRSIEAAVKLNYPSYEVILCDDSTDDTPKIIREYQNSVLFKGEKLNIVKGDGWELSSVEVKPGVVLKHLHRTTGKGVRELRDRLIKGALKIDGIKLTGHPTKRAPHIASFTAERVEGEALVLRLSDTGIIASSGSACTSGDLRPSHVLTAMGIPPEKSHGSLRFSLSASTTKEEIDFVVTKLAKIINDLRLMTPDF